MATALPTWADTLASESKEHIEGMPPLLVNEITAAEMLGVSKRTLFDLNKRGLVKSIRLGKLKRYSVAHLRSFAEGRVA